MPIKPGIQHNPDGTLRGCQYAFGGMNNVIDPTNLSLEDAQVVDGVNVDFDNTNSASTRLGYTREVAGAFHSGWSNDDKSLAYMVSDGWIYEFDGTSAPYAVVQLTSNDRVEFCQVNDTVVYSNGLDFGVLGGDYQQTRTYSPEFKRATKGGRCLEFYNGRLYFARVNNLYCTDVFDVEHVDIRFTRVATFQHAITMCKRVEDGLWIGTSQYVYFLQGDDIREGGFSQTIIAKAGVVYGTACKTNAEFVPEAQNTNNVVLFFTSSGICSGGNGGKYVNHSFNEVTFNVGTTGTAFIRHDNGTSRYIACIDTDKDGLGYAPYVIDINIPINPIDNNDKYVYNIGYYNPATNTINPPIIQGSTFLLTFTVTNIFVNDGIGTVIRGTMKESYNSLDPGYDFTAEIVSVDADLLACELSWTAEETALIPAGEYVYDCEIEDVLGFVFKPLQGRAKVQPEVTP